MGDFYEGRIFRPPSEAYSLIVQSTIGCSHNRCAFCTMYKEKQFRIRSTEDVIADLESARGFASSIKRIFFADGDAFIRKSEEQLKISAAVKRIFPECERVSMYASPKSVLIKTDDELKALHEVCRENNLLLYADGARLGVALTAEGCDVTLADMARYCDFFCIGGTKNGALFGEALVLVNPCLKPDFLYIVKQRGGLFAKGRLLGIQFAELFRDGLYYELARHANGEAMRIKAALTELRVAFQVDSPTNQQFIYLSEEQADALRTRCTYDEEWRREGRVALRLCTSWATQPQAVDELIAALREIIR